MGAIAWLTNGGLRITTYRWLGSGFAALLESSGGGISECTVMYQALAIPLVFMIQADHWVMDVKFIKLDAAWTARNSRMREKNQEAKSTDYR
jgi:hypothetical protein